MVVSVVVTGHNKGGIAMSKLTTAKIRKLNDFGRYGDGGGLYLNVSKGLERNHGFSVAAWTASGLTRAWGDSPPLG